MKTKKAAMLRGALAVYLSPKLRGGARIDLDSALKNVTSANYSRIKGTVVDAVQRACRSKLAVDEDLDDLAPLMDALEQLDESDDQPDPDFDDSTMIGWLRSNLTDAQMLEFRRLFLDGEGGQEAEDDPPPFEGRPSPGGAQDSAGFLERYPLAGLIGGEAAAVAPGRQKVTCAMLDDSRDDFLGRFPEASRIGIR